MLFTTTTCALLKKRYLRCAMLVVSGAMIGCNRPDPSSTASEQTVARPVLRVRTTLHRILVENSIAVTSVSQPGVIFGANDSGQEPLLFAFDSLGRHRGVWGLLGAGNRDWEAGALGPCAAAQQERSCLYIGDTGDNGARRPHVTVYRIVEPTVTASPPDSVVPWPVRDRLEVRYPDRPHDVEAMYVALEGSLFLITKRRLLDGDGRARPALLFQVAPGAWDSSGTVTARLIDSLPIVPGQAQGRQVTDAALSPDGTRLAVRTYAEIFLFAMDPGSGRPLPGQSLPPCSIRALDQERGEGIGWWWDQRKLVLTSEGRRQPLHVVECPLPRAY
jgi:hypothetical protein